LEDNASGAALRIDINVERCRVMQAKSSTWRYLSLFLLAVFVMMIILPYVHAYYAAGSDHIFVGFLLNPLDGNSYLAKMYQGWAGEWQFTLPYTAEKGEGSFLFLFYLFLGHLSRWAGLSLITVFHLARVLGAVCLFTALTAFSKTVFQFEPRVSQRALILALFGSGMGWILVPTGHFTSDFWVAEAYPFLSAYTNPHFAFGLALLLMIFLFSEKNHSIMNSVILFSLSILLAIIQPFGIAVAVVVIVGTFALETWERKCLKWQALLPVLLGGGIPLLYQYWTILTDPLLSGWNAQNLTPAPPLWDLVLSLSPALLLASYAIIKKARMGTLTDIRLPAIWLIVGLLMIFFPFNLQRRFMLGIYIPAAMLAVTALTFLRGKRLQNVWMALLGFSLITNLLILSAGVFGSSARDPALYLTRGEYQALEWMRMHTSEDAVILVSPEMGRYVPALTGRRVLYGHPFETVNAEEKEQLVTEFLSDSEKLRETLVDYIFLGPREREFGEPPTSSGFSHVYQDLDVIILKVEGK
jgi:hypothetical protein